MQMSETRGLGREALVYSLAKVLNGVVGFAAMYLFTRLLLPDEYGYYWLVIAGVELTTMLSCSWIAQTMKRYHPELSPQELPAFMGRIAGAYIVTFALLVVLTTLVSLILPLFKLPAGLAWLVLVVSIAVAGYTLVEWLFRIHRRPWDFLITVLTTTGGRLVLGWILLVLVARTGQLLLLAYATSAIIATAWGLYRLRERWDLSRYCFSWESIRALLGYGLPITVANGSLSLMNSGGRLILGLLKGEAIVGVFAAAAQLARQLMELAVAPVQIGADPLTMRVYEHDGKEAAARYLKNWLGLVLMMGSGVSLSLYLLRSPVVASLLAPKYAACADLLGYLAPAMVFYLGMVVAVKSHELAKNTAALTWYFTVAGVLNVALNFALIPSFGAIGAALALLLSYAAIALASYITGQRLFPWQLPWKFVLLMLAPLAMLLLIDGLLPVPSGLFTTFLYGVGYMLAFLAFTGLLLWLFRRHLSDEAGFIRLLFSPRSPGSADNV